MPAARERPWACSRLEVPWEAEGLAGAALHCLACAYGVFALERHRALADCETGLWLLAQRLPRSGRPVLGALLERALAPSVRLWTGGAPPEARGRLRARGYRWMPLAHAGIPRSWWVEVAPEMAESERRWLIRNVYGPGAAAPIVARRVDAHSRWRSDPADCEATGPVRNERVRHGAMTAPGAGRGVPSGSGGGKPEASTDARASMPAAARSRTDRDQRGAHSP